MATIRIQNVGPIRESGIIRIVPVNLFIGKQSSGKSTFLKILCYCRWIDKQVSIGSRINGKSAAYVYSHYMRFIREMMHFYRFNESYFSENSRIEYDGDGVHILFCGGVKNNAQISSKLRGERFNSKLCFVPSERNLLSAMKNIQDTYRSSDMDMLFNFVFEWGEYRESFTPENKLRLTVAPEMEYYFDKDKGEQIKILNSGHDIPAFPPFYASSGIQSSFPLEVIVRSMVDYIGRNAKLSQSDLTQILARLIRDGVSSGQLQKVIESRRDESRNLLTYQAIQLFVEEPEQNLFPESQAAITRSIVKAVKEANRRGSISLSSVVMTTHSPYVLSTLNVLMAASEAFELNPERTVRIIDEGLILPKGAIRAYSIDADGMIRDIIDKDIFMVDGTFLDGASENVENELAKLNEIICSGYESE